MTHHIPHPFLRYEPSPRPAHVAMTLRLANPSDDLLVRHVRLLRDCVALAQKRWDFTIDAAVVLPSEIEMLCTFADAEIGVSNAARHIAATFERHVPGISDSIWADTGDVQEIPDELVSLRREFIEAAPVRAGLVIVASDWPYSSAHVGTAQGGDLGVAVA